MRRIAITAALAFMALPFGTAFAQTCIPFFDQQAFRAYNESQGKFTKGIETFEEAVIAPGGKNCFPDPLGPDPSADFPTGLEQKNLIIQTNLTPGPDPPLPNPSGDPCALYAIGGGFIGSNSVKVGEDLFLQNIHASIDLIFTEPNHTGIGFRLSRFIGFPPGGWHITVYDKGNMIIGVFDVPQPAGAEPFKEFFGISCTTSIGRINIFDMAGPAPDAIDDIEMWQAVEGPGLCTPYLDPAVFHQYSDAHGKFVKGIETFEEGVIDPGGKNCFPAPLGPDPHKNFPDGLQVRNIIIQDNITPGQSPPFPNPSGDPCALYAVGAGFIGSNSIKVGEDLFLQNIHASIDLIFTEPNHTGVGFRLSRFDGFPGGGWHITAYDKGEQIMGEFDVAGPTATEPFKEFFAVWCGHTLGRINIFDKAGPAPDAIDDIELWQENPTSAAPMTWGKLKVIYRK